MPGRVKRTSAAIDEDEEQSIASSLGSAGSKRPRYDRDASIELGDESATNAFRNPLPVRNGDRDDDEYTEEPHQPGSIVRVTLTNFVTYTAAEFHPGPSLNMVIGPNGTGKSTLVCAICLGLGWDPKNLGRAKEIGEFVKHGSTEAIIEIELAADEHHDANPVIRRNIKKEGNKSAFFINTRPSSQKEVVRVAKSFSIQIDNLCQFLPQDRVVEFAGLSPVALLKETLRAAAPEQMVTWHEELKDLRADEKHLEVEERNEDAALKQLQIRQNSTREDVERWHQRQELVTKAKVLEKCRPVIETTLLKKEIRAIKLEKRKVDHEFTQLSAEAAPARAAQEEMEAYRDQVEQIKNQRKVHVEKARQRADKLAKDIESEKNSMEEYTNQINAEKADEKERRQSRLRLEQTISKIERDMNQSPVEVDEAGYRTRRAALQDRKLDAAGRSRELIAEIVPLRENAADLKAKLKAKSKERTDLDTQNGQQANLLQRISKDTAKGWDWIQQNREHLRLKGEVYGPPILTCSVTDPRYADFVESQFGGLSDSTAITFTNGDDQRLISNKLLGKNGLGLHQITLRLICQPLAYYRAPVSREELRNLGFDGWILDYIQGPEPVLAMLCDSAQLHRAAYTPTRLRTEQHEAIEKSPIPTWIAGRDKYRVTRRSEYGVSSTRVQVVTKGRFFTDQPVDVTHKSQLDDEIRDIEQEIKNHREQHEKLKARYDQHTEEQEQAKLDIDAIDSDHKQRQKARAAFDALPEKKAGKEEELASLIESTKETNNRILSIKTEAEKAALKTASLAVDYQKAVSVLRHVCENLVEAELRLVEANSEVDSLKAENNDIIQTLENLRNRVRELEAQRVSKTNEHNQKSRRTQQSINELPDEEKVIMVEYSALPTIEDLSNEIEAVHARLHLMADGNPQAVKAYESRERDIEQKKANLDTIAENLQTTRSQIHEIRGQWEPRLDELIATISDGFSHNFAQIGCAGQVGVHKDEDFEKWSVQIQVRFRANETLSILDSQRQSGGERAVSTIFYLMALQDLARSPFRVVDEINQGMDPRNERMVHERMVDIACRERTSQYFLITPKLLSDLKFHPKMKIHCIASGEHMPDQYQKLDFQNLAEIAIQRKLGVA